MAKEGGSTRPRTEQLRDVALEIIDREEAKSILKKATGDEPEAGAIRGYRYTFSKKAVQIVTTAGEYARRRGREITGSDVGTAVEQQGRLVSGPNLTPPPESDPWIPVPEPPGIPTPIDPPQQDVHDVAKKAIGRSEVAKLLDATEKSSTDEAVKGLRHSLVNEAVAIASRVGTRAKQRGRGATGEDVGVVTETNISTQRIIKPPGSGRSDTGTGKGGSSGDGGSSGGDGSKSGSGSEDDSGETGGPGSGGGDYFEPPNGGGSDDSGGSGGTGTDQPDSPDRGNDNSSEGKRPEISISCDVMKIGPKTVKFDASSTSASGGAIVRYEWAFGDGSTATGKAVYHEFKSAGTYSVTLTVVVSADGSEITKQATKTVEIWNPSETRKYYNIDAPSGTGGVEVTVRHTVANGQQMNIVELRFQLIITKQDDGKDGERITVTVNGREKTAQLGPLDDDSETANKETIKVVTIPDNRSCVNLKFGLEEHFVDGNEWRNVESLGHPIDFNKTYTLCA